MAGNQMLMENIV